MIKKLQLELKNNKCSKTKKNSELYLKNYEGTVHLPIQF